MKHINGFMRLFLFGVLVLCLHTTGDAQIIVSPANTGKSADASGFYYALPRNFIKLDFILEKNQRFRGPYADFTSKNLGVEQYVKQDEVVYTLLDVIVTTYTEPDPAAYFFVEFDERGSKDARSLVFNLMPDGIILAADDADNRAAGPKSVTETTLINAPESSHFQYYAERNLYLRVDTIMRKITIDTTTIKRNILQTSWVDRNPEQKAKSAADMINKIRESRYNLISGYQEINYGQSIVYMNEELNKLEDEYLSLFLGKESRSIEKQTLLFLPEPGKTGLVPVAKLNDNSGITDLNGKGENIQLKIDLTGVTQNLINDNKNTGRSKITNSVYYRIPEYVEVAVMFKGRSWAKQRMAISQLGPISVAPVMKTRLVFDAETGMIKTVKRD
ncbi:MAG: DUF4831 family protein [Bacteroidetes bacterium]|nr:DUF4831 family protein [Bacteroidota bacterium]